MKGFLYFLQRSENGYYINWVNIDGTGFKRFESYKFGADSKYASVIKPVSNEAVWMAENYKKGSMLRKINLLDGSILSEIDLTYIGDDKHVTHIAVDSEGRVIAAVADNSNMLGICDYSIYVYSEDGNELFDFYINSALMSFNNLLTLQGGLVAVAVIEFSTKELEISLIDYEHEAFGQKIAEMQVSPLSIAEADMDIGILVQTENGIVNYKKESSELVGKTYKLLDWTDISLSSTVLTMLGTDNGSIVLLGSAYDSGKDSLNLVVLRKSTVKDERITLKLGCMTFNDDRLRDAIAKFNQTNSDYRIEIVEYYRRYSDDIKDYQYAITKLSLEIMTENAPDIIMLASMMPFSTYVEKGVLEDLTPYLNSEPECKLTEAAVNALNSPDGKIYRLSSCYGIDTYIGDSKIIGNEPGWTLEEAKTVLAAYPERTLLPIKADKSSALYVLTHFMLPDYINWHTGEVKIDKASFYEQLEWANSCNGSDENFTASAEDLIKGRTLGTRAYITSFMDFQVLDAAMNGRASLKGFPCETRQGSAIYLSGSVLAMNAAFPYKEAAWRLMRTVLTDEYYRPLCDNRAFPIGIPTVQSVFDEEARRAMTDNYEESNIYRMEITNKGYSGGSLGSVAKNPKTSGKILPKGRVLFYNDKDEVIKQAEYYAMTEEQLRRFTMYLNSIKTTKESNFIIEDIVEEDTAAFFAGDKTAEETAKIIQNRVSTYVNENR